MPKTKKKNQSLDVSELHSETVSQLDGLRLVRAKRPTASQAKGSGAGRPQKEQGETRSPEPEVITKLIDFIKSI